MEQQYAVSIPNMIDEFQLETVFLPPAEDLRDISRNDPNRPGLALTGFFGHFEPERLQVIGKTEYDYLSSLSPEQRQCSLARFMERRPIAVIITTGLPIFTELHEAAIRNGVPLLRSAQMTSELVATLISWLNVNLAPRMTRHGVLVEVYGEGLLICGDSGIGKSETAIELVKRGHCLIADDAVEIKKVSSKTLIGCAPATIRHYMELRGIGIINVRRMFGISAVKDTEKIDLVIHLEPWVQGKMYDRLGIENETTEIMGIRVPSATIPVKPGRNLAIILEIAAMNNHQKRLGYNTAAEFEQNMLKQMELEV